MFSHPSESCGGTMKCSVYLPPQAESSKVPVLYWLSGLTCTHENFITKAGAQKFAAELGIMLVAPDTSPREAGIDGEDDAYDLGTGAGFYINATQQKWASNYRMEDYIIHELPKIIETHFPALKDRQEARRQRQMCIRDRDTITVISSSPVSLRITCVFIQKTLQADHFRLFPKSGLLQLCKEHQ